MFGIFCKSDIDIPLDSNLFGWPMLNCDRFLSPVARDSYFATWHVHVRMTGVAVCDDDVQCACYFSLSNSRHKQCHADSAWCVSQQCLLLVSLNWDALFSKWTPYIWTPWFSKNNTCTFGRPISKPWLWCTRMRGTKCCIQVDLVGLLKFKRSSLWEVFPRHGMALFDFVSILQNCAVAFERAMHIVSRWCILSVLSV